MNKMASYQTVRDVDNMLIANIPADWDHIKQNISNGNIEFGRSVEMSEKYKVHMKTLEKEWWSIESYIRHHYLQLPYKLRPKDDTPDVQVKYVDEDMECESKTILFCENGFPYYLTENIQHKLIWSSEVLPMDEATRLVHNHFPPGRYDVLICNNPNKSVKTVHHLHVFIREKSSN